MSYNVDFLVNYNFLTVYSCFVTTQHPYRKLLVNKA